MPINERSENKADLEPTNATIDRLCAAIRLPRSRNKVVFLGWTESGVPTVSTSVDSLGTQAKESYAKSGPAKEQEPGIQNLYQYLNQLPIYPVEYLMTRKPFDQDDIEEDSRRHEFSRTQDMLRYVALNSNQEQQAVDLQELDILNAILDYRIKWQDYNPLTAFQSSVIKTRQMFSLAIPTVLPDRGPVLMFMMFKPADMNESNDIAFRDFLERTIETFVNLDAKQIDVAKKGYQETLGQELANEGKIIGGDAYKVLNFLRNIGIRNISDSLMDKYFIESSGKTFGEQLLLVAHALGLREGNIFSGLEAKKGQIQTLSTEQLLSLLELTRQKVMTSFKRRYVKD